MNASSLMLIIGVVALGANVAAADAPQSAGVLELGSDNTLFVADALSGAIHAVTLSKVGTALKKDAACNLPDLGSLASDAFWSQGHLRYCDLALHAHRRRTPVGLGVQSSSSPLC